MNHTMCPSQQTEHQTPAPSSLMKEALLPAYSLPTLSPNEVHWRNEVNHQHMLSHPGYHKEKSSIKENLIIVKHSAHVELVTWES